MHEKGFPRLTKKAAQALAVRVVGTAKGLTKVKHLAIDTYEMALGELTVTIQHDWYGTVSYTHLTLPTILRV